MRYITCPMFERAAAALSFNHAPEGDQFFSRDRRISVAAVYKGAAGNYTQNIDRRQTLVAMKRARKAHRAAQAAKSETTGALTPMASV